MFISTRGAKLKTWTVSVMVQCRKQKLLWVFQADTYSVRGIRCLQNHWKGWKSGSKSKSQHSQHSNYSISAGVLWPGGCRKLCQCHSCSKPEDTRPESGCCRNFRLPKHRCFFTTASVSQILHTASHW